MSDISVSAVIVAGGKGIRMSGATRKQYLLLAGRPILSHTLAVFDTCDAVSEIVLVIPEPDFDFCRRHILSSLRKKIHIVPGGAERQDSVYNGLAALDSETDIVLIHDGVRPFVRHEHILACIREAEISGACILGIPAFDTLKQISDAGNIETTLARDKIWLAQTPQCFRYDLILAAHKSARRAGYVGTDDASLLERLGTTVKIIMGSRFNIKITTREDLVFADAIFSFTRADVIGSMHCKSATAYPEAHGHRI